MSAISTCLLMTSRTLLLWAAGLGAAMQFAKISITFDAFDKLYPAAGPQLGFLVSLLSMVGIFLGLSIGSLITRIGVRRALLGGLMIGASISVWQATLPSFGWLLASRLLEGVSHLLIVVAAPTLIAMYNSGRGLALAMTLWSTFFGTAFAITAVFAPVIISAHGLPMLLLAHALSLASIAAILSFMLPPDHATPESHAVRLTNLSTRPADFLGMHLGAYRSPGITIPALGWLFYTMTFVALLTVLPPILPDAIRQKLSIALPMVSIVTALTLSAGLLSRFSPARVVLCGFVCATVASIGLTDNDLMPIAVFVLFAAFGLIQSGSFALIPALNHSPKSLSLANGAMAQMGNLGNTIGTPLLLALHSGLGMEGIVGVLVVCYLLAILTHSRMHGRAA